MTQNAYFSLSKHTKNLLFVTYCDMNAETGIGFWTQGQPEGQTNGQANKEVEIVI